MRAWDDWGIVRRRGATRDSSARFRMPSAGGRRTQLHGDLRLFAGDDPHGRRPALVPGELEAHDARSHNDIVQHEWGCPDRDAIDEHCRPLGRGTHGKRTTET